MTPPSDPAAHPVDRRIIERCPVDGAAEMRPLVARNQPTPAGLPVTVVDVTARGALLRGGDGVEFPPGHTIELGVDDGWSRCRIVWGGEGIDRSCICGVEFLDARPAFVSALLGWIEQERS